MSICYNRVRYNELLLYHQSTDAVFTIVVVFVQLLTCDIVSDFVLFVFRYSGTETV